MFCETREKFQLKLLRCHCFDIRKKEQFLAENGNWQLATGKWKSQRQNGCMDNMKWEKRRKRTREDRDTKCQPEKSTMTEADSYQIFNM